MWQRCTAVAVVFCLTLCAKLPAEWAPGPPLPVTYREIPDPPDEAERHIVVKGTDRGPVWLLTGFLHGWRPDIEFDVVARVKPKHWREDLMDTRGGSWPLWYPQWVLTGDRGDRWSGSSWRGSPVFTAKWLEMILALRGHPMPGDAGSQGSIGPIPPDSVPLTYQVVLGSHFVAKFGHPRNVNRIGPELIDQYRDFTGLLVKYAKLMGVPVDYWEVWNEPPAGPHYLAVWDAAHEAIRSVDPDAKMVGPSCGGQYVSQIIEPFLVHCKEKGHQLDVLAVHEMSQNYAGEPGLLIAPDKIHWNMERLRSLVERKYAMLGVQEIHIDEWGENVRLTGPGTQIAFFYYMDLAGVHRAGKVSYGPYLDGLLIGQRVGVYGDSAPSVMSRGIHRYAYTPRTSYWAWVEYAKQEGGVRLFTETNDRCMVLLASRHDQASEMRALLARSKRDVRGDGAEAFARKLPPVKVQIDFEGVPISGKAELTLLNLGPGDGPVWEDELPARTEEHVVDIIDGTLRWTFDRVVENQVCSIRIAPMGTRAKERAGAARRQAEREKQLKTQPVSRRERHLALTRRAQKAADEGVIRISCGAALAFSDPAGHAWFADREYEEGSFGFASGGGTVDRGPIPIEGTDNPELYSTELWAQRSYSIRLPNGKYLLRLHFAEVYRALGLGGRVFDIVVEGKLAFKDFEALREAGGYNKICVREVDVEVSDGVLTIDFPSPQKHTPMINGIEVVRK